MRIKNEKDFWSGVMFVVVGLGFAIGAAEYSLGPACQPSDPCATSLWARFMQLSAKPGAGFFPLGLGLLQAVLGAVVLFKALTIETEGGDKIGKIGWRPLFLVVLAVVAFGLALPRLGMFISLPLLIIIASLASDEFSWKGVIASCVVLTLFSWLIFIKGLNLIIPLWPVFLAAK
ncbi:MAG: membrane protein [Methylibium sp. NZG]|nr:MAG: membrane protein [Methylibium sp. NZG]